MCWHGFKSKGDKLIMIIIQCHIVKVTDAGINFRQYSQKTYILGVTGKVRGYIQSNENLNDYNSTGAWGLQGSTPSNAPSALSGIGIRGFLEVIMTDGASPMQILYNFYDNSVNPRIFCRCAWNSSSWSAWKEISTDIPTFYKNYGSLIQLTNHILQPSLTLSTSDNIDTIPTGIACLVNATQCQGNRPPNALNTLIVTIEFDVRVCQFSFDSNTSSMYMRFGSDLGSGRDWNAWQMVYDPTA